MKKIASFIICFFIFSYQTSRAQTDELGGRSWNIVNGEIQLKSYANDKQAVIYWNYLKRKLPVELLEKYIYRLRLFSDGEDAVLGEMSPLNGDISKWEIALDTRDFDLKNKKRSYILDYTHTLIHEFGHLLTLNPEQIEKTNDQWENSEKGYLTNEGYAKPDSYFGKFVNRFWRGRILEEWDRINDIEDEEQQYDLLDNFYRKYKSAFLTDYASKTPGEDIAESWTFFVLSDKPKNNEIKYQKVLFFYQYPELVTYRRHIREQLDIIPDKYIEKYK